MPDNIFDNELLSIPCDCGHKIQESIGRLKTKPDLICPKCAKLHKLDDGRIDSLIGDVKTAEKQLADFRRKIKEAAKKLGS